MKTFDELREGFVSAAQRKAVWASRADGGKGHPDNKKKKSKKEDVQELDTSTLISYRKKANKQRFSSDKKTGQRTTGIDMANKKLRKRNIDKFGKHSPKGVDKMGNPKEDYTPAQKAAREKSRIGPKGEVGKREYGSDKAKRGFHKAQRGVSGKGDNRNTMSIFDRQPKTALQGNKPKGKLPEDSDAVKAFLAKGGKIKKLPPAKAQGYHGKDDPGKGMHGMMDKPDTKAMGTRKKVKSMESLWDNIRKRRAAGKPKLKPGDKNYPKTLKINDEVKEAIKYTHVAVDKRGKVAGMASKASDAKDMARRHGGTHHQLKKPMHPKVGDMMINRSFNPVLKAEKGYKTEKITLSKVRKALYKGAKALGDVQAVRKKRVGKRIVRRAAGKVAGRALGKLFR